MVARREGLGEEIVKEFGIYVYTLLHLKWITNRDLPYSTGNSAQYYVSTWMGGEFGREWIHVHAWLSPFAVHLKLSQIVNQLCAVLCLAAQPCLTLCDPMDYSLPDCSIHGIFQARILEWIAISFSKRSSQPRDWTGVSRIVGRCFTMWATREALITRANY